VIPSLITVSDGAPPRTQSQVVKASLSFDAIDETYPDTLGRLFTCNVDELHPHPGYVRNNISIPASQLSLLTASGNAIFREPITTMPGGILLDGYARVHLARQQGRLTLPAIEYDFSEATGLQWLLQKHRRSPGLNDFTRISLALELEPWLKEQAIANQQRGGQCKGSSNLTEAHRVDVRSRVASVAGVSTGNISKARRLISGAHPQVLEALRTGEVSIHQASTWLQTPREQLTKLHLYQDRRGISGTIRTLLKPHRIQTKLEADPQRIMNAIATITAQQKARIVIAEVKAQGSVMLLSTTLLEALLTPGELQI
jgi:hypothetical protein